MRAWGRLGYPRRALRLREAAVAIAERHGGEVPTDEALLRALPGVGGYTAAAVAAFAFGTRTTVVDTNVRRVLVRAVEGREHAAPALTAAELALAASLVPADPPTSATWNVAVMELGALVCRARATPLRRLPGRGPLRLGRQPADPPTTGRPVAARPGTAPTGRSGARCSPLLRETSRPVPRAALEAAGPDAAQVDRCIASLVEDGLIEPTGRRRVPPARLTRTGRGPVRGRPVVPRHPDGTLER